MVAKKAAVKMIDPDEVVEEIEIPAVVAKEPAPVEEESEVEEAEEEDEDEIWSVDTAPADEELWVDGPTAGQIRQWKLDYPECDLYVTSVTLEKHYLWRTLERNEYRDHIAAMEALADKGELSPAQATLYNEEVVTEMCVLFPQYRRGGRNGGGLAGVPSIISQEVMEASGFVAVEVRQL